MASHFALFVDLENCGGKKSMLMDVIERVKIRGDILIGKVYGYTDSYSDLKETLLSNTFAVVPSLRFGRNQKNSMDIQLVIDALDVAYTNPLIDSFCIVSGDSDYVPLVGKLKTMGKFVLGISRSEAASGVFMNACSEFQFLESVASGKERAQGQEIEALTLADRSIQGGARGLDMGRNIFQSNHPVEMAKAIRMIVHQKATDKEAFEFYTDAIHTK